MQRCRGCALSTIIIGQILLLLSCQKPVLQQIQTGVIVPLGTAETPLFSPNQRPSTDPLAGLGAPVAEQLSLYLPIPDDYIPHQIYENNIDADIQPEQIVIYKHQDDQNDLIKILLIDYDFTREKYTLSWQGSTRATSLQSFNLYTEDITGNQQQEIVAIGIDNEGSQTLDIFQQEPDITYGLQFSTILSIQADIAVEIAKVDPSFFPEDSEVSARGAYPVIALNYDLESENALDMEQSSYIWENEEARYRLSSSEKILGLQVEQDQLAELYAGSITDFHQFVEGLWQKIGENEIILFSKDTDSIQLATTNRQLHFRWRNSTRWGLGSNVALYIQNEIVSNITQIMQITVSDLNTLLIQFSGETNNTFWSGTYQRITDAEALQSNPLYAVDHKILYPYELSGLYTSDSNGEMFFSAPYITLRTQDRELNGGFVIFQLNGQNIFELNFFDEREVLQEKQRYLITFEQNTTNNQLQRYIYIQEATLTSYGAQAVNDEIIRLEQIIELDG